MPSDRVSVRDRVPVRARCHLPTCPFATACPFATTASTTTFLRRQVPSRKTTSCSSLVKGAVGISSISTPSCARTSRGSSFGRSPRPSRAVTAGTLSAPRQNCHACARWRPVLGTAPRLAPAPAPLLPRPTPLLPRPAPAPAFVVPLPFIMAPQVPHSGLFTPSSRLPAISLPESIV